MSLESFEEEVQREEAKVDQLMEVFHDLKSIKRAYDGRQVKVAQMSEDVRAYIEEFDLKKQSSFLRDDPSVVKEARRWAARPDNTLLLIVRTKTGFDLFALDGSRGKSAEGGIEKSDRQSQSKRFPNTLLISGIVLAIFIVGFVIWSFIGGPKTENASLEKATSQSLPNLFSKRFSGAIDNRYQIEMSLQRNGTTLAGSYFYTKHRVDISIQGTIDDQGNLSINEFDNNGNQTGMFKGKLSPTNTIDGIWSKPNGDKPMTFTLSEIQSG